MLRQEEGPLGAQLPIRSSVVGRYDIVVRDYIGIDRLVTELEDAPHAAADRHGPAIIVIGLPAGGNERARGQIPAPWEGYKSAVASNLRIGTTT